MHPPTIWRDAPPVVGTNLQREDGRVCILMQVKEEHYEEPKYRSRTVPVPGVVMITECGDKVYARNVDGNNVFYPEAVQAAPTCSNCLTADKKKLRK